MNSKSTRLEAHPQAVPLNQAYLHNQRILLFTNCISAVYPLTASFPNDSTIHSSLQKKKMQIFKTTTPAKNEVHLKNENSG